MSRKTIFASIFILAAALAAALLPTLGQRAEAQPACTEFRAIGHATLPTPHRLSETDTWGADVWGTLGGQFFSGFVTGNDGSASPHGVNTTGSNGSYTYVFDTGSFLVEIAHADWPFPPGKAGLGYYRGNGKIVQGTGRFENASGNVDWAGPFVVWSRDGVNYEGRFNPEIRGNICGIE